MKIDENLLNQQRMGRLKYLDILQRILHHADRGISINRKFHVQNKIV